MIRKRKLQQLLGLPAQYGRYEEEEEDMVGKNTFRFEKIFEHVNVVLHQHKHHHNHY